MAELRNRPHGGHGPEDTCPKCCNVHGACGDTFHAPEPNYVKEPGCVCSVLPYYVKTPDPKPVKHMFEPTMLGSKVRDANGDVWEFYGNAREGTRNWWGKGGWTKFSEIKNPEPYDSDSAEEAARSAFNPREHVETMHVPMYRSKCPKCDYRSSQSQEASIAENSLVSHYAAKHPEKVSERLYREFWTSGNGNPTEDALMRLLAAVWDEGYGAAHYAHTGEGGPVPTTNPYEED